MPTIQINEEACVIPEKLSDISIARLIKLRAIDLNNPLEVFEWGIGRSIALSDSKKTERQVSNTLGLIYNIISDIHVFMASDERFRIPETVEVLGLTVKIKPGIASRLPYWASAQCRAIIKQEHDRAERLNIDFDPTDRFPEIIGHYLYSEVARAAYDEKKADEFCTEVISEMPMTQAVQLGNFFLLNQKRYLLSKPYSFLLSLTLMRKRLALRFSGNTES